MRLGGMMPNWVKVFNGAIHNPKMTRATTGCVCDPFALWVAGLCYANEHLTDGKISRHALASVIPGRIRVSAAVKKLVASDLWHEVEDGWIIHDYLEIQRSAEQVRSMSEARSRAGRRGGKRQANAKQTASKSEANGKQALSMSVKSAQAEAEAEADNVNTDVEPGFDLAARRQAEEAVFLAWVEATGRTPQTSFDPARRRVVRRALALKDVSLDDVLDAVRGARHSEHHMSNKQWSELRVVLRDMGQIEHFRDLERASRIQPALDSELVSRMPGNRQLEREAA